MLHVRTKLFLLISATLYTFGARAQTSLPVDTPKDTIAIMGILQGETNYPVEQMPFRFIEETASSVFIDGKQYQKQISDMFEDVIKEKGDRIQFRYIPLLLDGEKHEIRISRQTKQSTTPYFVTAVFDGYTCWGMRLSDFRETYPSDEKSRNVLERYISIWCNVGPLPEIKDIFTYEDFEFVMDYLEKINL